VLHIDPNDKKPHFETASSWKAARAKLTFQPREPGYTAGLRLHSIRIHVRDHKLRDLSINDRLITMPPLFILFDEGAAAVFSTGTVFVVGVIRLTLSGSYQRSSHRFVLRAAAECLLLDDAQRACLLGRP